MLTAMNNLAESLSAQGDLPGARTLREQVVAGCRRILGDEHPDTVTAMHSSTSPLPSCLHGGAAPG